MKFPKLPTVLIKFFESLISRKMVYAFITQFEKMTIIGMVAAGSIVITWELVVLIGIKDIVILATLGMVQFEKVNLGFEAKVGNG